MTTTEKPKEKRGKKGEEDKKVDEMTDQQKNDLILELRAKQAKLERQDKEKDRRIGELSTRNTLLEAGARLSSENQRVIDATKKDSKGKDKVEKVGDLVNNEEVVRQLLDILKNISEGKFWGNGGCHDINDLRNLLTEKLEEIKDRLPYPL